MEQKVKEQLEFYLSDRNLSRDSNMRMAIQQKGGLTLDYLMQCNMIKRLVSSDRARLQAALRNIKSDVFEVNDGVDLVRRRESRPVVPLDNFKKEDMYQKTVHMSGFPLTATQVEINDWCRQFGTTYRVYLKHFSNTSKFDGSAYVTFVQQDAADRVVGMQILHFQGTPIRVKYPNRDMKGKIMARVFS